MNKDPLVIRICPSTAKALLSLTLIATIHIGGPAFAQRADGTPVYAPGSGRGVRAVQRRSDQTFRRSDVSYQRAQEMAERLRQRRQACDQITVTQEDTDPSGGSAPGQTPRPPTQARGRRQLSGREQQASRMRARMRCVRALMPLLDAQLAREIRFITDNAAAAAYRLAHLQEEVQYRAPANETSEQRTTREQNLAKARESLDFLVRERDHGIERLRRSHQFLTRELNNELECINPRNVRFGVWVESDWIREQAGRCERPPF